MISPCNGKCSLTAAEIMFPYHHNIEHLNGVLFKDKSQLPACFLILVTDLPKKTEAISFIFLKADLCHRTFLWI